MDSQPIIVCHDCDLILDNRHIPSGYASNCPRCGAKIPCANPNSIERVLVFCLTALILYIPATFLPIMDLNSFGFTSVGNIFNSVTVTFQQGFYLMAAVLLLTAVIIPLLLPLLLFIISMSILTKRAPALQATLLRTFQYLKEWGMSDIYLLGILIAIIKIAGLATIQYRVGFFCFIGLTVFTLLAANALHKSIFWGEIGDQLGVKPDPDIDKLLINNTTVTAKQAEIVQCHDCHFLIHQYKTRGIKTCPRCQSHLHYRKPDSIIRTWAFLIVSIILIFPANLFPIMELSSMLTGTTKSTIMDGIIYFFNHQEYGIGLIIFVASILIPLYKILGLLIVLITVNFKWSVGLKYKIIVFRLIGFIGRWSMLDIFVIAIMSVFVNFGSLSTSAASSAAIYFCIVVIATMRATDAFDLRLLWDD